MATNKDFTMKQYNGTDYDVLYPKNTSQQTLLNDSTLATALGLTATNPEIDQALTEIVSKIATLENGAVKIQTGSYVGTGTYGVDNPCSLTFDFVPELVIIMPVGRPTTSSYDAYSNVMSKGLSTTTYYGLQSSTYPYIDDNNNYCHVLSFNNTVAWYNDPPNVNYGPGGQQNYSGKTYTYFAVG